MSQYTVYYRPESGIYRRSSRSHRSLFAAMKSARRASIVNNEAAVIDDNAHDGDVAEVAIFRSGKQVGGKPIATAPRRKRRVHRLKHRR